MKALSFVDVNQKQLVDKDKPQIQNSTDAVIRLVKTTICGTDLHILAGHVPEVPKGSSTSRLQKTHLLNFSMTVQKKTIISWIISVLKWMI